MLRYGGFYGPGTTLSLPGGEHVEMVRRRRFPVVGEGGGVWSFIHIEDAAEATLAAIDRGTAGSTTSWTTSPRRCPNGCRRCRSARGAPAAARAALVGRMLAGQAATVMMTEVRGASNVKAKRELGWQPQPSELARGLRGGGGVTGLRRAPRSRAPSRSATACSAAWRRPRTWSRRRSCASTRP